MGHHGGVERVSTTVVALVGGDRGVLERFSGKANVAIYCAETGDHGWDQAIAAWSEAGRTHTPYFVHDADPLAWVAETWAGRFEGTSPVGELEVAVRETLARWRTGSLGLPDYYLLWSPDSWLPGRRHWYLGVLGGACPLRVVVTDNTADPDDTLVTLAAGPWWPELDELLDNIDRVVPDRVGLPGDQAPANKGA
jgi:hypothetical protein